MRKDQALKVISDYEAKFANPKTHDQITKQEYADYNGAKYYLAVNGLNQREHWNREPE